MHVCVRFNANGLFINRYLFRLTHRNHELGSRVHRSRSGNLHIYIGGTNRLKFFIVDSVLRKHALCSFESFVRALDLFYTFSFALVLDSVLSSRNFFFEYRNPLATRLIRFFCLFKFFEMSAQCFSSRLFLLFRLSEKFLLLFSVGISLITRGAKSFAFVESFLRGLETLIRGLIFGTRPRNGGAMLLKRIESLLLFLQSFLRPLLLFPKSA